MQYFSNMIVPNYCPNSFEYTFHIQVVLGFVIVIYESIYIFELRWYFSNPIFAQGVCKL